MDYISKFIVEYLDLDEDGHNYRNKMFTEENSKFFLTELYPLPKNDLKTWSNEYKEIFGFSSPNDKNYISEVKKHRFPMLFEFWEEKKPELTICFGKGGWNDFIELFSLNVKKFNGFENVLYDESKNVFLTLFFGRGYIPEVFLKELVGKIKGG